MSGGGVRDGDGRQGGERNLAAAREARTAQEALAAAGERQAELAAATARLPVRDPLALCIYTTVALLAWLLSPGLVAALFALAGLTAYARAWRAGLRQSDCVLGDPRLVMLYLALVAAGGLAWTAWRVLHLAARAFPG